MSLETYDDIADFEEDLDDDLDEDLLDEEDLDEEDLDEDDLDDMLEALMDMAEDEEEDPIERRRRRRGRRRRRRGRRRRRVTTAKGRSAYRAPVLKNYVTQKQFKSALGRLGREDRRNAKGIKTVNIRVGKLNGRVDGVVSVNRVQSKHISKLNKQMQLDGALEFAGSYDPGSGSIGLYQLLKGAVKSGMLGDAKGAMGNPLLVGGIGLLLREDAEGNSLLSNFTSRNTAA